MNTSDFAVLRTAAASDAARILVDRASLADLLQQLDALRLGQRPAAIKADYPQEFEECWSAYPKRPGASKSTTYKAWVARLKAGATVAEMLLGTRKYAAYILATRTAPQYVLQPATFYGPGERFSADWTAPNSRAAANDEAKRRLFGGFAGPGALA